MNSNLVSAVFDSHAEAETAVAELRREGVSDSALSVVARHGEGADTDPNNGGAQEFIGKAAAGAGIGTLLGIAALAIPGVGPLVGAGAIAASAVPTAAVTGAALGGAAGGLEKVMTDHGVDEEDARYYNSRIEQGGVFVSVDTGAAGIAPQTAADILSRAGGHSASRPRTAAL
ncbi:hypothetical protein [Sphingomonas jeddahensis]|uniref:Heat induced stress protein YflT n=1 Tax=Sphingomonas jeddahensis TaxID=1915074 RepID=A0A1V2EVC2_9SPHN|nr:hypothetical protein [Sphingomonas jeddahensis]ONF96540.1 hypothetical protein SPHI_13250 [Sphingomonas jeddahensis]